VWAPDETMHNLKTGPAVCHWYILLAWCTKFLRDGLVCDRIATAGPLLINFWWQARGQHHHQIVYDQRHILLLYFSEYFFSNPTAWYLNKIVVYSVRARAHGSLVRHESWPERPCVWSMVQNILFLWRSTCQLHHQVLLNKDTCICRVKLTAQISNFCSSDEPCFQMKFSFDGKVFR
jgi:hypothetical protein